MTGITTNTTWRLRMRQAVAAAVTGGLLLTAVPASAQMELVYLSNSLRMLDSYPGTQGMFVQLATPSDLRNTAIVQLSNNTRESVPFLQGKNDTYLAEAMNYYLYLQLRGVKASYIKTLSVDDMRNTTIVIVNARQKTAISTLQGMSGEALLQTDKFPFAFFNQMFNQEMMTNGPTQVLVSDSAGKCGQYRDAVRRAGAFGATVSDLKAQLGPLNNDIGNVLDRIRRVPALGFIIRKMISNNPLLRELVNRRDSLMAQIRAAEEQHFRDKAVIADPSVLQSCQACETERETQIADRNYARPFGRFIDYIQDMRSLATGGGGSAGAPAQTGSNLTSGVFLEHLDDPNLSMPAWYYLRSVWFHRNRDTPQCS